jgi:hypothetical protein
MELIAETVNWFADWQALSSESCLRGQGESDLILTPEFTHVGIHRPTGEEKTLIGKNAPPAILQ